MSTLRRIYLPLQLPDGDPTTPAAGFLSEPTMGFTRSGAGVFDVVIAGNPWLRLSPVLVRLLALATGGAAQMVTADATGNLSTQAIPSGTVGGSGTTEFGAVWTGTHTLGNAPVIYATVGPLVTETHNTNQTRMLGDGIASAGLSFNDGSFAGWGTSAPGSWDYVTLTGADPALSITDTGLVLRAGLTGGQGRGLTIEATEDCTPAIASADGAQRLAGKTPVPAGAVRAVVNMAIPDNRSATFRGTIQVRSATAGTTVWDVVVVVVGSPATPGAPVLQTATFSVLSSSLAGVTPTATMAGAFVQINGDGTLSALPTQWTAELTATFTTI